MKKVSRTTAGQKGERSPMGGFWPRFVELTLIKITLFLSVASGQRSKKKEFASLH